ncbi:Glutaminyl cyclase [Phaffia rhodozyma]|uniref:Peptide hydrolase n=1 Tax=Phaffia rhodozyma TaxID=264483 RepID=A0A0F7SM58_PHARH|nr:Glutaminyl cyclase [Phaffia rhodozyma]
MLISPFLSVAGAFALAFALLVDFGSARSTYEQDGASKRTYRPLNSTLLDVLTQPNSQIDGFLDHTVKDGGLSKILIPRTPGSDGNRFVQKYITSVFEDLKWTVETDRFTDKTPFGEKEFTNLIFTFDPDAPRRIVLSAHHDSKFFLTSPRNKFVGATDSAFPCTLLLSLATSLTPLLNARKERLSGLGEGKDALEGLSEDLLAELSEGKTTIQIVFFDGEEAYQMWTDTDSTYGSRHLAEKWSKTYRPSKIPYSPLPTELTSMDFLLLLDLLGAPNPTVPSFYPSTHWLFERLKSAERRLGESGKFIDLGKDEGWVATMDWEQGSWFKGVGWGISDDHLPFLRRGVEILHVITSPFPRVWHTLADDATALHIPTMKRWDLVLRVFVAEYLGLQPDSRSATVTGSSRTTSSREKKPEEKSETVEVEPTTTARERANVERSAGEL